MSNDKYEAARYQGAYDDLARWGQPPAPPVERPWVSPGPAPWVPRPSSTVAVWALATGVVGVLAGWCLFGLPCIAAVVLGHLGVNQTKDGAMSGRGMAVTGLILGYVALVPAIIMFVWLVAGGLAGGAASVVTPMPSAG